MTKAVYKPDDSEPVAVVLYMTSGDALTDLTVTDVERIYEDENENLKMELSDGLLFVAKGKNLAGYHIISNDVEEE